MIFFRFFDFQIFRDFFSDFFSILLDFPSEFPTIRLHGGIRPTGVFARANPRYRPSAIPIRQTHSQRNRAAISRYMYFLTR